MEVNRVGSARKLHWRQLSRKKQGDSLRALAGIERIDVSL